MSNSKPGISVLLVNPNRMRPSVGPLGLELAAEALREEGMRPAILDLAWERSPRQAIGEALGATRPAAVGISIRNLDDCYYASQAFLLPALKPVIRAIRAATSAPIILGGVGFSIAPLAALEYLESDYGIRGDAEESFPALVRALAAGKDPRGIPGLVRRGGKVPPVAMAELSGRPAPRRDSLDLQRYFQRGGQGNLETQRGCNRKCIYCADPVAKGRRLRFRPPEAVAEEVSRLASLGVHALHFCDSEFNVSRRHAEAVCRAMIRAGLGSRVKWWTYALPKPMDTELACLFAEAGCAGIDFGADAADEGMLEALGRDFGVEDLFACAQACKKAGIVFMFDLLLGGPGETKKSLATTVRRLKRIQPDRVGVSFGVRVFPGTELARMVLAEGPLTGQPALHGNLAHNPDFLKPVFYVSDRLGPDPELSLKKLINDDPRFLFASRDELRRNYNYNNNRPLVAAIKKGARGAYWDIIRRMG